MGLIDEFAMMKPRGAAAINSQLGDPSRQQAPRNWHVADRAARVAAYVPVAGNRNVALGEKQLLCS